MKKMQTLALALALVALGAVSWSATRLNSSGDMQKTKPKPAKNLNSSRSNVYRIVYEKSVVSSTQATAILKDLDKLGKGGKVEVEVAKVKEIVKSCGVREEMKEILYFPKTETGELPTYIMFRHPIVDNLGAARCDRCRWCKWCCQTDGIACPHCSPYCGAA